MEKSPAFLGPEREVSSVSWLTLAQYLVTATASILLLVFYRGGLRQKAQQKGGNRMPPGPQPWPIIGNLDLLSPLTHHDFQRIAKVYGPIFRLRLGWKETIVVSSPEIAEEILKTNDAAFSSRPKLSQFEIIFYNGQSVAAAPYGPYWRYARKVFTLELLTNKRIQQFQNFRKDEVLGGLQSIIDSCKDGNAVKLHPQIGQMTMNNITRMMMNKTYFGPNASATNLAEAREFKETMKDLIEMFLVFDLGDYIPFLKPFDLQGNRKRMRSVVKKNDQFIDKLIEERRRLRSLRQKSSQEEEVQDLLDILLTRSTAVNEKPLTEEQIKGILLDVLLDGTDTTSISVEWAMTELLRHPTILKKAQDELDAVVGRDRLVEEADLHHLKYLKCIAKEALRLHCVGPIMLPHECIEACEVAGYHIPVKSQVFVNVYAIARDPGVWERALEFYPERFLSTNIDVHGNNFELLPFGSGRRGCPGKNLGLVLMEYILAAFVHACDWSLPAGVRCEDVDLGEAPGSAVCKAIPLEAVATPRLPLDVIFADRKDLLKA